MKIQEQLLNEIKKTDSIEVQYSVKSNLKPLNLLEDRIISRNKLMFKLSSSAKSILKLFLIFVYRIVRKIIKTYLKIVDPSILEINENIRKLKDENNFLRLEIMNLKRKHANQ